MAAAGRPPVPRPAARRRRGIPFWVDGLGTYDVRPGGALPRIVVPAGADPIGREERLWGIPAVLCFLARGDHSLHAGSVDLGGRAVAFGAPGRFGKTTLAAAFAPPDIACWQRTPRACG